MIFNHLPFTVSFIIIKLNVWYCVWSYYIYNCKFKVSKLMEHAMIILCTTRITSNRVYKFNFKCTHLILNLMYTTN